MPRGGPTAKMEIGFAYRDYYLANHQMIVHRAGYSGEHWGQYSWEPLLDVYGYQTPIFVGAAEAISAHFNLGEHSLDIRTLAKTPPEQLESMGRINLKNSGVLETVTTFIDWSEGGLKAYPNYRAERLASGLWVIGRYHPHEWEWSKEPDLMTDHQLWRRVFRDPAPNLSFVDGWFPRLLASIFLCHSSADKPFVRQLAQRLSTEGVQVWLDEAEIKIGDSIIQKLEDAIDKIDYIGVVLSPNAVASQWVQQELRMAQTIQLATGRVKLLPIHYIECEIPGFLRDKLYADFRNPEDFETSYLLLLDHLLVAR
jgi:hypothetical protein